MKARSAKRADGRGMRIPLKKIADSNYSIRRRLCMHVLRYPEAGMLRKWYADWMVRWETALTTRDTNRVVRPLEWGFDWLAGFSSLAAASAESDADALSRMIRVNKDIVQRSEDFYGYTNPSDFRLEDRHPELFPTNVRPETLRQA